MFKVFIKFTDGKSVTISNVEHVEGYENYGIDLKFGCIREVPKEFNDGSIIGTDHNTNWHVPFEVIEDWNFELA